MSKITSINVDSLIEHYKKKGNLTLIGLNDSQLINIFVPYVKGSFDRLASTFIENGVNVRSVNAGSTFFNKSEHLKAILDSNLTVEDIRLLTSYSYLEAHSKVLRDVTKSKSFLLPDFMERIYRRPITNNISGRESILSLLQEEPIVIASILVNDIMRAVANDPWTVKKDYANRNKNSNFDYTVSKVKDEHVLIEVMDKLKSTLEYLLSRTNGSVYSLGFFLPKMMEDEGYKVFKDFVDRCNLEYENICKSVGVNFVDLSTLGSTTGNIVFNANPNDIRDAILLSMLKHFEDLRQLSEQISIETPNLLTLEGIVIQNHKEASLELIDKGIKDRVALNTLKERIIEKRIAQKIIKKRR